MSHLLRVNLAAWVALWCWQAASAAEAEPEDPSIAEMKVVDADMERFKKMLEVYDDPYYKPRIMVYYNAIALRIEALRKAFDQQKADDLRFDLNQQVQRMSVALRPLITPPPTTEQRRELSALNPSAANPAEVKAAMSALDSAIARLEADAKAKPAGQHDPAKIERAKQRRAALAKNFTEDGWKALTMDLEAPQRPQWIPPPPKTATAVSAVQPGRKQ